jgi:hypothetical protein
MDLSPSVRELEARLIAAKTARPASKWRQLLDDPEWREQARQRAAQMYDPDWVQRRLQRLAPTDVVVGDAPPSGAEEPKRRKRRPTIASIARQAANAGLVIVRVEFDVDGRIVGVVMGKSDEAKPSEWDGVLLQ